MIVSYDPMAGTIEINAEDGRQPFEVPVSRLLVQFYGDAVLWAEAHGTDLDIGYIPLPDEPFTAGLYPVFTSNGRQWRIKLEPTA